MSNDTTVIPEGWAYEPGDPSVGIFGESFWHDDCTVGTEIREAVVMELGVGERGEGGNHVLLTEVTLVCEDCHESAKFIREDWDPNFDDRDFA